MWSTEAILTLVSVVIAIVAIVGSISSIIYHRNFVLPVARSAIYKASRLQFFCKHYGPIGIALWCFASREVWQIQLKEPKQLQSILRMVSLRVADLQWLPVAH